MTAGTGARRMPVREGHGVMCLDSCQSALLMSGMHVNLAFTMLGLIFTK